MYVLLANNLFCCLLFIWGLILSFIIFCILFSHIVHLLTQIQFQKTFVAIKLITVLLTFIHLIFLHIMPYQYTVVYGTLSSTMKPSHTNTLLCIEHYPKNCFKSQQQTVVYWTFSLNGTMWCQHCVVWIKMITCYYILKYSRGFLQRVLYSESKTYVYINSPIGTIDKK